MKSIILKMFGYREGYQTGLLYIITIESKKYNHPEIHINLLIHLNPSIVCLQTPTLVESPDSKQCDRGVQGKLITLHLWYPYQSWLISCWPLFCEIWRVLAPPPKKHDKSRKPPEMQKCSRNGTGIGNGIAKRDCKFSKYVLTLKLLYLHIKRNHVSW